MSKKYYCKKCDYMARDKRDYSRHCSSDKHIDYFTNNNGHQRFRAGGSIKGVLHGITKSWFFGNWRFCKYRKSLPIRRRSRWASNFRSCRLCEGMIS